jgi:hypothetical protein
MAHKSSSSSDDEDYNHYEDHYAEQIGKSVKCTQFINNTTAMKGQVKQAPGKGQVHVHVHVHVKQGQVQKKKHVKQEHVKQEQVQMQVKDKVKAEAPQTPTVLPRNIEKEIVDDWEDLLN